MQQNKDEKACSPCENEMNQEKALPCNDETSQERGETDESRAVHKI